MKDGRLATIVLPYIRHVRVNTEVLDRNGHSYMLLPYQTLETDTRSPQGSQFMIPEAGEVYQIPCGSCSEVCVGKTSCVLNHHLRENSHTRKATADHAAHHPHDIDWAFMISGHPQFGHRYSLEAATPSPRRILRTYQHKLISYLVGAVHSSFHSLVPISTYMYLDSLHLTTNIEPCPTHAAV